MSVNIPGQKPMTLQLRKKRTSGEKTNFLVVPIQTFAPEPFEVLQEIKVVVRPSHDEFIATFFDANVNASGCNETDAVANLKEMLVSRFEQLDCLPENKLGPGLAKQIAVLREFIGRK
jgi:hypothetical protein